MKELACKWTWQGRLVGRGTSKCMMGLFETPAGMYQQDGTAQNLHKEDGDGNFWSTQARS